MRIRGVLAIEPRNPARLAGPEQRRLLETCASLLAISLERIHYIDVAQSTTVQMESERLRNSLLAAISHDLRTPLAALVGMADSLGTAKRRRTPGRDRARDARGGAAHELAGEQPARHGAPAVRAGAAAPPVAAARGGGRQRAACARRARSIPDGCGSRCRPTCRCSTSTRCCSSACSATCSRTPRSTRPPAARSRSAPRPPTTGVRVTVDDYGPGLPRQREEAIFEMFERGRKESATPGVGLGLAICRAIVEAHGGTIRGETRPSGGARFTIELPRGEPPPIDSLPVEETEPEHAAWRDLGRMSEPRSRVLVVEDEPEIRRFVRLALEREGHEVFEADSVERGAHRGGHAPARSGRPRPRPARRRRRRSHPAAAHLVRRAGDRAVGAHRRGRQDRGARRRRRRLPGQALRRRGAARARARAPAPPRRRRAGSERRPRVRRRADRPARAARSSAPARPCTSRRSSTGCSCTSRRIRTAC